MLMNNVVADDEVIELYPYNQEACLLGNDECTRYKIGDSHWDVTYNGYNYNVARGNARYVSDFNDANSTGEFEIDEITGASWGSFGGIFINNTDSEAVLVDDTGNRAGLAGGTPYIWAYFDEDGNLAKFEQSHVNQYYIHNDGDETTPDWRLATEDEITAYQAEVAAETINEGDTSAAGTDYAYIRMIKDDSDSDGYVLEPLAWLKWYTEGFDTGADPDETHWSILEDYNPVDVVIPAGWTVLYFGYLDRDGSNTKTMDFIKSFASTMANDEVDPAVITYDSQPGWFVGLNDQDDDPTTPGINIVVDYQSNYRMPSDISAEWLNMYSDEGDVINSVDKLDFSVEIYQEDNLLQTIDYTWNAGTGEYDASSEQTVIDTSVFGSGYEAVYKVETPEGDPTEASIDIVIGVMPPKFIGVEDVYSNEGVYIDIMDGISADDGYGNDVTDSIIIKDMDGLNVYYPQPGTYDVDLEFTHHVHFDGEPSTVTINGVTSEWDPAGFNSVTALNVDAVNNYAIFTDSTMAQDVTWAWGSVMVLVGADGLVDAIYDRYTWDVDDETGSWNDGGSTFETWKAAIDIEPGGFVIASHGSNISPALRALSYDDPVSFANRSIDTVTINGVTSEWDAAGLNSVEALNVDATNNYAIFTDSKMAQDVGWAWGSVMVLVGADGLVDAVYDRYTWDVDDETGSWNDGGASFETWKAAIDIEDGGFVIASHGSIISPALRALTYDDPVSYMLKAVDFDYDIVTQKSFTVTIDDTTDPYALVVDDNYTIDVNEFDNVNEAILANVVAFDNFDSADDLAVYVSANGGLLLDTAGTYTVEVTVEDMAGNATVVTFDVTVVEPDLTAEDVQAMIDAQTLTEAEIQAMFDDQTLTAAEIQALLDAQVLTTEDVQALIDGANILTEAQIQTLIDNAIAASQPEDTGCGSATANIPNFGIIAAFTLLGAGFVLLRKHQ